MKFAKIANAAMLLATVMAVDETEVAETKDNHARFVKALNVDMGGNSALGISYINGQVVDQRLKLGISTSSATFSIVGDKCENCKVSNPLDIANFSSGELIQPKNAQVEENSVFATSDNHLVKP